MRHDGNRLFVITGGPGAGKTTLVDALAAKGFPASREAGRHIIQQQVATGGDALPWADREAFAASMLDYEIMNYRTLALAPGPVFFDRGIPDIIGYRALEGLAVSPEADEAAARFRYNRTVFLLPPWREIYATDTERKQSFAIAQATCRAMERAYRDCGYELIAVPLGPVAERVAFVLETASALTASN